jgi:hypothetical protein
VKRILRALLALLFIVSVAFAGGFTGWVFVKGTSNPASGAEIDVFESDEMQDNHGLYSEHKAGKNGGFGTGPFMDSGYYWIRATWYDEEENEYNDYYWGYYEEPGWTDIGTLWVYQGYPCPW